MNKKKRLTLISSMTCLLLSIASIAKANGEVPDCYRSAVCKAAGFVFGVQAGFGDTHWDNVLNLGNTNDFISDFLPNVVTGTSDDDGFAARGYLGFDITPFFGIEAGYADLPNASSTLFLEDGTTITNDIDNFAIDLLGKIMVPLVNGLSVYAKAGGGYFHSQFDVRGNDATSRSSASHIGPAYGVGAAYEVIPNLALDVSWMRYNGDNKLFNSNGTFNNNYQPNPDLFLVGISYKFPVYYYEL